MLYIVVHMNNEEQPSHERQSPEKNSDLRPRAVLIIVLCNAFVLVASALLVFYCVQRPSVSVRVAHGYKMWLAGASCGLVALFALLKWIYPSLSWPWKTKKTLREQSAATIVYTLLTMACIFGTFNYYRFDGRVFREGLDHYDLTYYYINSKYFNELGYNTLYPALLVADSESGNRFRNIKDFRDLHNYDLIRPREYALEHAGEMRELFSPERWESFKKDVSYFSSKSVSWQYFFRDHGYNPPPTWTLVGGTLSRLISPENLKWITLIDLVLMIIAFGVIARMWSAEAALFAVLLFTSTHSGTWPLLGNALLRFDWLAALALSVCALKANRHMPAGMLMAYSALTRVFPAIFFFPYFVYVVRHLWKNRTLADEHKKFIYGALTTTFVMVGLVLVVLRPDAIPSSAKNLSMHASTASYSSLRVGLGDAMIYRGETTRQEIYDMGGIPEKARQIERLMPQLKMMAVGVIAIIVMYILISGEAVWYTTFLAVYILFCLQNPQINYYNLRIVLVAAHACDLRRPRNIVCLMLLFGVEVVTQWANANGLDRYAVTSYTSIGLCVYFGVLLLFMFGCVLKKIQSLPKNSVQSIRII